MVSRGEGDSPDIHDEGEDSEEEGEDGIIGCGEHL